VEHPWGEMDKDAEKTTEPTSRLAVCNMDWDRVRAVDLLMLFNSFKPETGVVKAVTVSFTICGKHLTENLNSMQTLLLWLHAKLNWSGMTLSFSVH
jgi:hypothetical protein